jgi:type I restriction enzyme, S subunit
MKKGWQTKALGEVLQKTDTVNPLQSPKAEFEYIDVSSVSNTTFQIEETQSLKGKDAPSRARRVVKANDIIFATIRPTLQRIAIVPEQLDNQVCSTGYFVLQPKPELDYRFLFYFLFTEKFMGEMEILQKGASYPAVTDAEVRAQIISFPPLAEQHRIVGLLDEAFEGIATAKANAAKNLQNARALFESHLQSVFSQRGEGWVEKRIEEWCDSIIDCVNKTAPVAEGPTPFKMIRTTNIRHGRVDVSSVRYVTEDTYKVWTRRQTPQKGDVILTREAPMGEVGMVLTDDKVFLGQRLVSYRANSAKLDKHFLLFALQSGDLQGQIHAKASGSTVQHMRVPDTKNLLLATPRMAKQREVVAQLASLREETQRLASLYTRKLAALEALKKSLLHRAFSGEL